MAHTIKLRENLYQIDNEIYIPNYEQGRRIQLAKEHRAKVYGARQNKKRQEKRKLARPTQSEITSENIINIKRKPKQIVTNQQQLHYIRGPLPNNPSNQYYWPHHITETISDLKEIASTFCIGPSKQVECPPEYNKAIYNTCPIQVTPLRQLPVFSYSGVKVSLKNTTDPAYDTTYCITINKTQMLDGQDIDSRGRYVNQGWTREEINTDITWDEEFQIVIVSLTKDLDKPEELLTDYGPDYWLGDRFLSLSPDTQQKAIQLWDLTLLEVLLQVVINKPHQGNPISMNIDELTICMTIITSCTFPYIDYWQHQPKYHLSQQSTIPDRSTAYAILSSQNTLSTKQDQLLNTLHSLGIISKRVSTRNK